MFRRTALRRRVRSASRAWRSCGSSAMTSTSVKKRSTGGYERAKLAHAPRRIRRWPRRLTIDGHRWFNCSRQLQLRPAPSGLRSMSAERDVRILDALGDVLDPLEESGQRLELRRRSHLRQRLDALQRGLRVSPRVLAGQPGHHPDFVDLEAAALRAGAPCAPRGTGRLAGCPTRRCRSAPRAACTPRSTSRARFTFARVRPRSGRSVRIFTTPWAARRSPYGSREPVGFSPAAKRPTSVSSLSASETAAQVTRGLAELRARRRRVGFDADRQVVEVDRLPDFLGQPFLARVDAAHGALELGELADHVGREIGLGQPRRLCGVPGRLARRRPAPRAAIHRASGAIRSRLLAGRSRASCGTAACRAGRAATRAWPCGRPPRRTARRAAAP